MYVDAIRRNTHAICERSPKAMSNKSYYEQNLVLIFANSQFIVITFNLKFTSATTFWYTNIISCCKTTESDLLFCTALAVRKRQMQNELSIGAVNPSVKSYIRQLAESNE